MKNIAISAALVILCGCCTANRSRDAVFQYSTISALFDGVYDGGITLAEAKKYGNFGIGTYDALDGEMMLLDGIFYQVKADGSIIIPDEKSKSPFLVVTFFNPGKLIMADKKCGFDETINMLEQELSSKNSFHAVRIKGNFSFIKTRSVNAQSKPYPGMAEAAKGQKIFENKNIRGTVIGFYFPEYSKGINVPGFHMHFLSDDRKAGGHVLDFTLEKGTMEIEDSPELRLVLPSTGDFMTRDFGGDKSAEINKVEKK